jgi:excisionase family DNA binding protein
MHGKERSRVFGSAIGLYFQTMWKNELRRWLTKTGRRPTRNCSGDAKRNRILRMTPRGNSMPRCQNTGTKDTSGIGAESVERPCERAMEVHRVSAAGQSGFGACASSPASGPVSEPRRRFQAVLGASGSSPTIVVKRRRTGNAWLSPRQFARRFGVGTSAVYGAVERAEVPAIRVGRHIRIPPDAVERILRYLTTDN